MKKHVITASLKNELVEKVTNGELTVSQAALNFGVPEIFVSKWVGEIKGPSAGTQAASPPSASPSHTREQDLTHLPPTQQPQHAAPSAARPTVTRHLGWLWWIPLFVVATLWAVLGFRGLLNVLLWAILLGCLLAVVLKAYRLYKALRPDSDGTAGKDRFQGVRVDGMIASVALLLSIACWFLIPVVRGSPSNTIEEPESGPRPSLTADELQLSSQTVHGYWKEDDAGLRLADDESRWNGRRPSRRW